MGRGKEGGARGEESWAEKRKGEQEGRGPLKNISRNDMEPGWTILKSILSSTFSNLTFI